MILNSTFFIANRRRLASLLDGGLIVITANALLQKSADTAYPFKQDSNFYYLTGLNDIAEAILVINDTEEFLILPKRTQLEMIFGGENNCDEIAKKSGIEQIFSFNEGWHKFKKMQLNRKKIFTIDAMTSKITHIDSFYVNPARRQLIKKIKRLNTGAALIDIRSQLTSMRQIKQPQEVKVISKAIEVTNQSIQLAKSALKSGIKEYELEAIFDHHFKKNNYNHAFDPIISTGKNNCVLHHIKKTGIVSSGEFVLFDVGAEVANYSADISRTFSVGDISTRQKAIYDAVKNVQQYAINLLKPGLSFREYVHKVDFYMGEELIKLGLINKNSPDKIRKYFPHGIGHSLGIDAHDPCEYKTIYENMVLTVEPGIYILEEGIGVRIEDDILITKNGAMNLSEATAY